MNDKPIEAEIVPSQAVAIRPQAGQVATITEMEHQFALAVKQRELISNYIREQLKPDKHFYRVPGASKPSLNKDGAEIILLPHGLVPDYERIGGPEDPIEGKPYQITVKCVLRHKGNPESFAGSGIGSASSHITTKNYGRKPRQNDPGLCHNATMKMAQKSAMIAAVLNSTAASEFFTQDIEDDVPTPEPPPKPVVKPAPAPVVAKPAQETPQQRKERFLSLFKGYESYAVELWVELGFLLPEAEGFADYPIDKIPATKKLVDGMVTEVKRRAGAGNPPPDPSLPPCPNCGGTNSVQNENGNWVCQDCEKPKPSHPVCPNCNSPSYIEMRNGDKVHRVCQDCGLQNNVSEPASTVVTAGQALANATPKDAQEWKAYPIPQWSKYYKEGLRTFGELDKNQLWWFCVQWHPKSYTDKRGKTHPPSVEDYELRGMLDKVTAAYGFTESKKS